MICWGRRILFLQLEEEDGKSVYFGALRGWGIGGEVNPQFCPSDEKHWSVNSRDYYATLLWKNVY